MLTYSEFFLSYSQSYSTNTRVAKVVDTGSLCVKDTCARDNCSTRDTYIGGTDIGDDFFVNICIGGTGSVGTIKRLGIYLRLIQILELKHYSPILENRIKTS